MPRLTFHGAAHTVTGSKYLLEAGDSRLLVDCGLFQGLKELRELNWRPLPFDVRKLDAVVLTHAHLDHVGYLPRIVKQGYDGPVYANEATRRLAEIILLDSAKCQESDAEYANRKGYSKHQPALPLYDDRDVERTMKLFRTVERGEWFKPAGPFAMRYHDAGHLLGSNMIEVEIREGATPLRLLFSGDVGRYDGPLYHDPQPPPECDYLICESTYGDRDHPEGSLLDALADVVHRGIARGGVMLMAAFAVGRSQQLIYLLQVLKSQNRIPDLPIYLDSPMACDATAVFREHREEHDLSEGALDPTHPVLDGPNVRLTRTATESKAINAVRGPAVILASSGMMTGGRIVHHLQQRLPDPANTIVIGGFQAIGTRGRQIEDGARFIRMFGHDVKIRAAVEKVPGLSGHADRSGLLRWCSHFKKPPRQVFLTHGEPDSAESLGKELRRQHNWPITIPNLGDSVELT